tara:strand:- start:14446 stop:15138 length:693 start_codon:yes stop_codon:yes gene_type:complete
MAWKPGDPIESAEDVKASNAAMDQYGVKSTGTPNIWNLGQGGPNYKAMMAGDAGPLKQQQDALATGEFGTKKPEEIAKAITLEQLGQYRRRPEQFGLSEAEKQAAADKAAAASGAQAATALTQAARAMKGGGMTGYASQAMREATAPGRQGAATASQQALQASRGMIEQKGQDLYAQLTGLPQRGPTVWDQAAAAAATEAMMSGADLGFEYMDQNLLGDGDYFDASDRTA